jgi:hypothetical protein
VRSAAGIEAVRMKNSTFLNHNQSGFNCSESFGGSPVKPVTKSSNLKKWPALAAIFLGSACIAVAVSSVHAGQEPKKELRQSLFVITDQEGYGTGDCLDRASSCGKIIADSFCESNGFKAAEYYKKADPDDITGSIASERKPLARAPQAFVISCK